jgi:hypothetical protein
LISNLGETKITGKEIKRGGIFAILVFSVAAAAVQAVGQSRHLRVYANPELGFRYVSPSEMRDETESGRADIQSDAALSRTGKALDLLLALISGADDTDPRWRSLTIESYPRQGLNNLDDSDAEAKMSGWVVGLARPLVTTKHVIISGQSFSVYVFGFQEGATKKGAVVWTTIRRGRLLSFVFAANSSDELKALTETMKTLQFF